MSCWKILNIDQTNDQKLIKRAYANKLKKNRPDENPDGFSELHAAYKQALNIAKYSDYEESEYSEEAEFNEVITTQHDLTSTDTSNDTSAAIEIPDPPIPLEPVDRLQQSTDTMFEIVDLEKSWEQLTKKVIELTQNPKLLNLQSSWSFLDNQDALINIEFKNSFSNFIFYQLVEFTESTELKISKYVINYLNDLFDWIYNRDNLELEYGYDAVESILSAYTEQRQKKHNWLSPKQHVGPLVYGNYYARLAAGLIDTGIFYFIYSFIEKSYEGISKDSNLISSYILLCIIILAIMEASPLQATLGKLLFGLKVVNLKGKRLNTIHIIIRYVCFIASTAAFKVTIWINIFLKDGRLLHDRVSQSIVVKS